MNQLWIMLIAVVSCCIGAFSQTSQPTTPTEYLDRGMKALEARDYIRAVQEFNEAIKLEPANGTAYLNRGLAHFRLQKVEEALADTNRAIELLPNGSVAYSNRSAIYHSMQKSVLARADAEQAIRLEPSNANAYVNRAIAHFTAKDVDLAFADLDHAIRLDPRLAAAYYVRGLIRFDKSEFDSARFDLRKAVDLNVEVPEAKEWLESAEKEWKSASAPPAWLPMMGDPASTPKQPAKCRKIEIYAPVKTVEAGKPIFLAAKVDGRFFGPVSEYRPVWSTTAGTMTEMGSTAVLNTYDIAPATTITVSVELAEPEIVPECGPAATAIGFFTISAPPPSATMLVGVTAPLDEIVDALFLREAKRHLELVKAKFATGELQIYAYTGPNGRMRDALAELNRLKAYLLRNGVDVSKIKFLVKGKNTSPFVELWTVPPPARSAKR